MVLIHEVFKLHQGPKIQSFQLYMNHMYREKMVDYWVNISLSKEVEELELNFALAFTPYTLPPNLLDSESLRILKLTNCHLHIPSQLTGLGFLNTIILKIVNVTEEFIQELFKNCLFLENMGLTRCRGITHLKIFAGNLKRFKWLKVENCHKIVKMHIDAPTLCTMYYSGDLEAFTMGNLLRLKDVTLKIDKEGFFPFIGIEKFMFAISHVHVLTTTSKFVKGLSPRLVDRNLEEVLPFCFWNLRELELFMNGSLCGPFNVVTFLNKCHCLEKVTINLEGHYFYLGFYWDAHESQSLKELNISLKSLEFVRINGFNFEKPVKKLVKFILEKAEHLKTLILDTTTNSGSHIVAATLATYDQLRRTSLNQLSFRMKKQTGNALDLGFLSFRLWDSPWTMLQYECIAIYGLN
ncbi:FBD-associated F-box protein At1g61320-like [Tripterygium wilfordii]|uniref:FBD-associated F-box protein At1g61320-like n=1 Tax=Tripterygium wilfordii TaxID=458696 RepID=UPI0018F806F2|nr:FBD-associated F-box protein At1g61320-like [Tripterygium wilfordii]